MKKTILSISLLTAILLTGCNEESLESLDLSVEEEIQQEESVDTKSAGGDEMKERYYFLTTEEEGYIDFFNSTTKVSEELSSLLVDTIDDNSLVKDKNHIDSIKFSYEKVDMSLELLKEMSQNGVVPKIFEKTHMYLTEMVNSVSESKPYILDGLENLDEDSLSKGIEYFVKADESTAKLIEEYNSVMKYYQ